MVINEEMTTMTINDILTKELPIIVAGLVREGVQFEVFATGSAGMWRIELTGGY
jgi:hypothetical protein